MPDGCRRSSDGYSAETLVCFDEPDCLAIDLGYSHQPIVVQLIEPAENIVADFNGFRSLECAFWLPKFLGTEEANRDAEWAHETQIVLVSGDVYLPKNPRFIEGSF